MVNTREADFPIIKNIAGIEYLRINPKVYIEMSEMESIGYDVDSGGSFVLSVRTKSGQEYSAFSYYAFHTSKDFCDRFIEDLPERSKFYSIKATEFSAVDVKYSEIEAICYNCHNGVDCIEFQTKSGAMHSIKGKENELEAVVENVAKGKQRIVGEHTASLFRC